MEFDRLRRREFISSLGGAITAWPLPVVAQEPGRTYRIGVIGASSRQTPPWIAFFDELRKVGFVEGQNLLVDERGFGPRYEQFAALAAELAKSTDVIIAVAPIAVRAAQAATRTVPILAIADDMVASGLVQSLADPRGNTTGVSILAPELDGKRQEILD